VQDNRHLDVGIVVVLRHEQQVGTGREASNARLQNGYYIARMSAKAFTGVLDPAAESTLLIPKSIKRSIVINGNLGEEEIYIGVVAR